MVGLLVYCTLAEFEKIAAVLLKVDCLDAEWVDGFLEAIQYWSLKPTTQLRLAGR